MFDGQNILWPTICHLLSGHCVSTLSWCEAAWEALEGGFPPTVGHISLSEVQYLGHTFSAKGMSPNSKKVWAVQDWPVPPDVTTLHSFLGLVLYYQKYIRILLVLQPNSITGDIHHKLNTWLFGRSPITEPIERYPLCKRGAPLIAMYPELRDKLIARGGVYCGLFIWTSCMN